MGENTKIEWADHSFNGWIGCQQISPACDNCYAKTMFQDRFGLATYDGGNDRVRTSMATWKKPYLWNRKAQATYGRQARVFANSSNDFFDNQVPEEWRNDLWNMIRETPNLIWMVLTKRPENIEKMLPEDWYQYVNVWLGVSAEDQARWDHRVPILLEIPAAVHFVSVEPMLEPIVVNHNVDWIICGGENESAEKARYMEPNWARALLDQCRLDDMSENHIAFFMKQMYRPRVNPIPNSLMVRQFPKPRSDI